MTDQVSLLEQYKDRQKYEQPSTSTGESAPAEEYFSEDDGGEEKEAESNQTEHDRGSRKVRKMATILQPQKLQEHEAKGKLYTFKGKDAPLSVQNDFEHATSKPVGGSSIARAVTRSSLYASLSSLGKKRQRESIDEELVELRGAATPATTLQRPNRFRAALQASLISKSKEMRVVEAEAAPQQLDQDNFGADDDDVDLDEFVALTKQEATAEACKPEKEPQSSGVKAESSDSVGDGAVAPAKKPAVGLFALGLKVISGEIEDTATRDRRNTTEGLLATKRIS